MHYFLKQLYFACSKPYSKGIIDFEINNDSNEPHYVDFELLSEGEIILEIYMFQFRQEIHMRATLAIAIAALVVSIFNLILIAF